MSLIQSKLSDTVLTILLRGRIDSVTAPAVESEIEAARAETPHTALILDADALEYVSSAGLRVILRLRKAEKEFRFINASPDVYDVLEMTGFTEMIPVEKAFRRLSVDGCPVIGKGAKGTVYRYNGDTIVKVYRDADSLPLIRRERELARRAFVLGIPTAISYDVVRVGESYGSVFELLDAKSFTQLIAEDPARLPELVRIYAEMLRQIHQTTVRPEDMPDIKEKIRRWCSDVVPYLPPESCAKLRALVEAVPDTMNMLHFDYHTNNVMMQGSEALLIDMDTLCHGHPIFELVNVYATYVGLGEVDPSVVEKFMALPYATTTAIWKTFLPIYLGTDDEARIREVEEKTQLLAAVRLLRHVANRWTDSDTDRKTAEYCAEKIRRLLERVSELAF